MVAAENVESTPQHQFIERVYSLPVVKSAVGYASDKYEKVKNYNALVGSTLTRAEQSIVFVAETAKPVVNKLEKQISIADSYACQGLDKLENVVPAITKTPEDMYKESIEYRDNKIQEIKDYSYGKINTVLETPYAQAIIKSVDTAVDLTENTIDQLLPATEEEIAEQDSNNSEDKPKPNVVQRVNSLSDKLRRRMYKQALGQVENLRKRGQDALDSMRYSIDLIQYAKSMEEGGRQKVANGLTSVQERAKWLWDELNKEENTNEEQPKTLDQQLLALARRTTRRAVHTFNNISEMSIALPDSIQKFIASGTTYTQDVLQQLSKATSLKDVSDIALKQISSGATLAQEVLVSTLSPIMPSMLSGRKESNAEKKED